MSFFEALTNHPILVAAILAAFFASLVSGIVGSYVVVKRITFIAGSISHAVLGGIGLSLWLQKTRGVLWASPLLGALVAAILSALMIGFIRLNYKEREDSAIAALWTVGMAIGVLFISQTPGFNIELTNFLIGNLLWVSHQDLWVLGGLDLLTLLIVVPLHKKFLAICFDEEQAELQGIAVNRLYLLLLVLIAISVVLLIQVVGILLVLTMLTIPAALANLISGRLSRVMALACLIAAFFSFTGVWVSFELDWPPGATIAILSGMAYGVTLTCLKLTGRTRER